MPEASVLIGSEIFENSDHIPPNDVAYAAENNQYTCYHINHRIQGISAQTVFRNNINSCITKCRYRI